MAPKSVKVWVDPQGDFLEVIFRDAPGYFRETADDRVMEKVDDQGNVLGFSILRFTSLRDAAPFEVALP